MSGTPLYDTEGVRASLTGHEQRQVMAALPRTAWQKNRGGSNQPGIVMTGVFSELCHGFSGLYTEKCQVRVHSLSPPGDHRIVGLHWLKACRFRT